MSEANNVWRIPVEEREHEIEIEHSTMTGKFFVKRDGEVVAEDRLLLRKKAVSFDVAGHAARVTLEFRYGGFGAGSALHFDERYVEPLRR